MKHLNKLIVIIRELRNFIIFWIGQSLSEIGNRLTGFGLGIWVYQNTHEVAGLSLVIFFTTLPGVLITPFVGALVDRWNRKWTIIFSDLAAATVTLALAVLLFTDHLEIWHTYITAFCTSVCGSFQMIAKGAALPMMVKKHQMGRANGLIYFSTAVGQLTAPILAGILIASIQLEGLLIVDFSTYLIGLFTLLIIEIPQPEPRTTSTQGIRINTMLNDIAYGWNAIADNAILLILLAFMTIHFFVDGMTTVLINPLILSFSSAKTFGSVMSIAGSGMLIGSILMSIWGGGKKYISTLFTFAALNGIALIITGIKPYIPIISIGLFLSFFTLPIILSTNMTIWQTSVNSNVQGRVISLYSTFIGLALAFGNLSASPLTDKFLEPMLLDDGLLSTSIGALIGTGQGRGIGFLMVMEGLLILMISISLYTYFALRNINSESNTQQLIVTRKEIVEDL
ncbi:MFS transporter [Cronbergia sp. UHCC 0137]|uniref:MFS transporter n=1 Tax=Cronbergia sp. UHCC 0137 TaxID=3110239 RepID=UPI002B1F304D|nr:MFS transporter [Cronbergia sp. UHCC 0137]MEA5616261.1 MFS transporter [Cronbergia sp. UHCC 0137]